MGILCFVLFYIVVLQRIYNWGTGSRVLTILIEIDLDSG